MFKRTAIAGLIPALIVSTVIFIASIAPVGAVQTVSTACPYGYTSCTCKTVTLSANPASPQLVGTRVTWTATAPSCPNPQFEFWIRYPNGQLHRVQYWDGGTWVWNTAAYRIGTYKIYVWMHQKGKSIRTIQASTYRYFTLTRTAGTCTSATLAPPTATTPAGSTVAFAATAVGCSNPIFEYWVLYPNGTWYLKRGWSSDASWNWSTVGLRPGTYTVHVWANQGGFSLTRFEAFASSTVTLTGCTSATLAPASGSTVRGTSVTFTATSAGCPNPVYEFWLQTTDGAWHKMRGFSVTATWTWSTTGYLRGTYHIHVWANQSGAYTGSYETFAAATRTVT